MKNNRVFGPDLSGPGVHLLVQMLGDGSPWSDGSSWSEMSITDFTPLGSAAPIVNGPMALDGGTRPKENQLTMTNSTIDSPPDSSTSESSPRRGVSRVLAVSFGLLLLLVGLAALAWAMGRSTDTSTETFSGPINRLVIEVNGRVTVTAAESAEVTVDREWLLTGAPDVDLTQEEGTLRVSADCGFPGWWCQTHVTASAPAGAEVIVTTAAGDVVVTGFDSGVDLTTSAGNVIIDIAGSATLHSSAGRIEGTVTDGNVDATTSAGRIQLTVLGDFNRISAITSAGAVLLTVPDDVYRVDADTSAGDIHTNVSTNPDATREIVARSSAGDITIDRATR